MIPAGQWLAILTIVLGLVGPAISPFNWQPLKEKPALFQNQILSQTDPASCPAAGCAPGQRLNFKFEYSLESYDPQLADPTNPNVKVCLYAPTGWVDPASISTLSTGSSSGGVTGIAYTPVTNCDEVAVTLDGYELIAARTASINVNAFGDSLDFGLRIAPTTAAGGVLYARLLERDAFGWSETQKDFTPSVPVTPLPAGATITVYVAGLASSCNAGPYTPCYLNSKDDLPDGVGTGLKDAVDIVPNGSTITLVDDYLIKNNTVTINKPIVLTGRSGALLTYDGGTCTNPMISLRESVTLRSVEINDGDGCSATSRTLVEINSPTAVLVESNTLSGGNQAIHVIDNTGGVTIRYNHIVENDGYGVYWQNGPGTAPLDVIGNNIADNGSTIECGAGQAAALSFRKADHNYWGSTTPPAQDATHCTIQNGRQLGALIAQRSDLPGVLAERVTVTGNKTTSFDDQIGYQRSGGDADFDLFIVNHGYAVEEGVPFTAATGTYPSPCGNFWNVFLPDGSSPNSSTLELFLKYDKTTACEDVINSNQLCDQSSDAAKYPLWWYDPVSNMTEQWDTTGQDPDGTSAGDDKGQTTSCLMDSNEMKVSIDNSGRPNLSNDLQNLSLLTGVQILKTFRLLASNNVITVDWSTNQEPDITGFIVLRSLDGTNFSALTELIARKGSTLTGSSYQQVDGGRTAGTTYYYRLKIMRSDGKIVYSTIQSVAATSATATITPTVGKTATLTRTPGPSPTWTIPPPTRTNTPTLVPTRQPTRIPSATPTTVPATATRPLITINPEPTSDETLTVFPGSSSETPTGEETISPAAETSPTFDGTAASPTSSSTAVPTLAETKEEESQGNTLRSLLIGFSSGMVLLGISAAWFFFFRRKAG